MNIVLCSIISFQISTSLKVPRVEDSLRGGSESTFPLHDEDTEEDNLDTLSGSTEGNIWAPLTSLETRKPDRARKSNKQSSSKPRENSRKGSSKAEETSKPREKISKAEEKILKAAAVQRETMATGIQALENISTEMNIGIQALKNISTEINIKLETANHIQEFTVNNSQIANYYLHVIANAVTADGSGQGSGSGSGSWRECYGTCGSSSLENALLNVEMMAPCATDVEKWSCTGCDCYDKGDADEHQLKKTSPTIEKDTTNN